MIIITFFLPLFSISFPLLQHEISFSGFEAAFGKNLDFTHQEGSLFALVPVIPPVLLLIFIFCAQKINKGKEIKEGAKRFFLFKNIFITAPVFNIFAMITMASAARIILQRRIADLLGDANMGMLGGFFRDLAAFEFEYGFILYILLNIILLVIASVDYFRNRGSGL